MTKNITFLVVDKHSGQGGLENVLIDITNGLEKYGLNTNVLMLFPPDDPQFIDNFNQIKVMGIVGKYLIKLPNFIKYPLWKALFKKRSRSFLQENFKQSPPDVIIVLNLSKNLLRIAPILKKYKKINPAIPIISWPHSPIWAISNKVIKKLKKITPIFDAYFAISSGLKRELQSYFKAKKIQLVYNPVSKANIVPRKNNHFIFIGSVNSPGKRVKPLLTILSKLSGEWSLTIVGAPTDCKIEKLEITQYAKQIGIYDKIQIHKWQEAPWELIQKAGILLLNSEYEGFGLVLVEAMMRGIPCLSSNCPVGPKDIIIEDVNGWLYELHDYDKCQAILQKIIDGTIELPSQETIQNSVNKFQTTNIVRNFKQAIIEAIENSSN